MFFTELQWRYLLSQSYFRVCAGATLKMGTNVKITNSRIIVAPGSTLVLGNNVTISNSILSIADGFCQISDFVAIGSDNTPVLLNIEKGDIHVEHHSKICARRFWVRYGGVVKIGSYTNINHGSEIRCDESVSIGNYNQISYNVKIWDTNTHNIYPADKRRALAVKYWPYFGKETERPKTKPVVIGDDCWLGENVSVLKGTELGNGVIVGYNTAVIGKQIPENCMVVSDINIKVLDR